MKIPESGKLLRIFIGESDRWHHQPLYEAIVLKARELGLAGATVLRGPMGFGANGHLHTAKILRLSADLPMVIELVARDVKINELLLHLDGMIVDGTVIRRATGGGLVPHDADWTYCLVFPPTHRWHALQATESYRRVHEWLAVAFTRLGEATNLAEYSVKEAPGQCFAGAEKFDLLWH